MWRNDHMEIKQYATKKDVNNEIKCKLKNTLRQMTMETQPYKVDRVQ